MDRLAVDGGEPVRRGALTPRQPFPPDAVRLATEAIQSGSLFGVGGPLTRRFESEFAAYYGARHAVTVSSGTAAIHTALAAANPEPGAEVITAPITDAGSVLPILYQGCVPVFADVADHLGMAVEAVEACVTPRTAAIIAVHPFGGATDVRALRDLADRHGITLIEDCSQAHGTRFHGEFLGRYGHIGVYSLQQSKHMTAGEGGVCVTDDDELAARMRLFSDKGWDRLLDVAVDKAPGVTRWQPLTGCDASYWCYPFFVPGDVTRWADALAAEGVPTTPGYIGKPIYECMAALADAYPPGLCPRATDALTRLMIFWLHENLTEDEIADVGAAIIKVANALVD